MSSDKQVSFVGIDLGTQSVRAVVVTLGGVTIGRGSSRLDSRREGGRHVQDPAQWWEAACEAIEAALHQARATREQVEIAGVAVDGTSGSFVLLDRDGTALGTASMYDDAGGDAHVERINEVGGEQWSAQGYRRMQPTWALPRLLERLRVEGADRVHRLAHQTDVVNRHLTGHDVATDTSTALKTGVDLARAAWPVEVFSTLGVPIEILPDVVLPGTVLGHVGAVAAAQCGLPAGTPVVSGMTDGCAAQLGAGVVEVGSCNSVLGTTLVLKGVTDRPVQDPSGVVYSHRSSDGRWLPGGASSTGAGVIARDFAAEDLDRLTTAAARLLPSVSLSYPLAGHGERFPFLAPSATGFLDPAPDGPASHLAAVMQGVAQVERLCLDYLDLLGVPVHGSVVLTGGATRNAVWNQLRADVLGRAVTVPESAEPASGMAMLAASVVTGHQLDDLARQMAGPTAVLEPRSESRGVQQDSYLRLVDELESRGWLPETTARHAHERSAAWS